MEGININYVVVEAGSVAESIREKALKLNVDLIIVGTKGASRLKEFFLGSTTKILIKKAPCLVLAVPVMQEIRSFKTIAYATDFEQADILAILRLIPIAKACNAQVRIVHITTQKEYAGEQQMEWFKEMLQQKVNYDKMEFDLIFSDTILEELYRYLEEADVDLLAMLERKDNTFIESYFQRDKVKQMVSEISIPLLSFNTMGL